MTVALKEGGTEGKVPNLEVQLQAYYKLRKWDSKTGFPTDELLEELNLKL
nr:hypothetical protein [Asgard group archaeon]